MRIGSALRQSKEGLEKEDKVTIIKGLEGGKGKQQDLIDGDYFRRPKSAFRKGAQVVRLRDHAGDSGAEND